MSTLQQLQQGLEQAWDNFTEGWTEIRARASHALTRFHPTSKQRQSVQTDSERFQQRTTRWGLLAAETLEYDEDILIKLEAPGLSQQDFDIQIVDDVLVVRGEKRVERREQQGHIHIMECAYGAFERAIPLPVAVDEQKASAKYQRGVLSITLPKTTRGQARRITVQKVN